MKKKGNIFIIVLLLMIFCLLIYLVYDYVKKENKNDKQLPVVEKQDKKDTNSSIDKTDSEVNKINIPKVEQKENREENKNKTVDVKEIILKGEKEITIKLNDKYNELGAKATDKEGNDISNKIEINSEVDTTKKGTYKVFYSIGNYINVRYVTVE